MRHNESTDWVGGRCLRILMSHTAVVMGGWMNQAIYASEYLSWTVSLRALWNIFSSHMDRGRVWAYKTGAHWVFLKISISLFWAQLQHLELIKRRTPKTPPPIRNRKGIKKNEKNLRFLSTDTPLPPPPISQWSNYEGMVLWKSVNWTPHVDHQTISATVQDKEAYCVQSDAPFSCDLVFATPR